MRKVYGRSKDSTSSKTIKVALYHNTRYHIIPITHKIGRGEVWLDVYNVTYKKFEGGIGMV